MRNLYCWKHGRFKSEGAWKTINGARVFIKDGKVTKGPKRLVEASTVGFHDGQRDGRVTASVGGKKVGKLDYSVFDNEIKVSMVEVDKEHRRQGIATEMYEKMLSDNPDETLGMAMMTGDGKGLRESIDKKFADRLIRKVKPSLELSATESQMSELAEWGRAESTKKDLDEYNAKVKKFNRDVKAGKAKEEDRPYLPNHLLEFQ